MKTNSHSLRIIVFNIANTSSIMQYAGFEAYWIPRKDPEMGFFFVRLGFFMGLVFFWLIWKPLQSASIGTMPHPSPQSNENCYFFSSTSSPIPSTVHLTPLVCQNWEMNLDEFSLKYGDPRGKSFINPVGFSLGPC